MTKKIEALSHSQHKDLRLSKVSSFAFAKNISSVKLTISELRQASRYYPIVFLNGDSSLPQALLSLEPGQNYLIDEQGNWKVPYVPAYLKLYPFMLATISDQKDKLALCIDPDAEHFKSGMGDPLFTADGKLTEAVQKILKALEVYQKDIARTQALFTELDKQGVIVDRSFKYSINQTEKSIKGFKGLDMKKLYALDDKTLAGYVKNGAMKMIYDLNDSFSNFQKFIGPAQK